MGRPTGDDQPESGDAVAWLVSPLAVHERCGNIFEAGRAGDLEHFRIVEDRMPDATQYVAKVIEARHPDLAVPPHSRWRHFEIGDCDLWRKLADSLGENAYGLARIRFDLAVTSVLLDAGAGPEWRFRHGPSGKELSRSEGLGIASFEAFRAGLFSSDPRNVLMADAGGLESLTEDKLAAAFHSGPANPLPGLANRVELLRRLGRSLADHGMARPAGLFDRLLDRSVNNKASILDLFADLQRVIGPIWPGRLMLDGVNLGDTWPHPRAGGEGPGAGLVPFHKLCQWMCYSLIEPAENAGLRFTDLSVLTPLAEYRNGGLIVDLGLIEPKHARVLGAIHRPGDEIVVEWRALTIPIILAIAENLRQYLALGPDRLPLAAVLEGGTWWAGRKIAAEKREGGPPPIRVVSDGTVF